MKSIKAGIDKEDYFSIQSIRKKRSSELGFDIGWISAYRNWKKMGYPKCKYL